MISIAIYGTCQEMHLNGLQEYSTYSSDSNFAPCVYRGGYYLAAYGGASYYTSHRFNGNTASSVSSIGLRPLLYVK